MEKTVNAAQNNTRNYGLDMLRCIAMLMVVILHFLDKGGLLRSLTDPESFTSKDITAWVLEALCIVAVNLYMLMSGYLLSNGGFKLSRLLGLVAKIWLYSVIVGFIGIALKLPAEDVDTYFKLRLLLPVSMNTYWFMTAYVFFYILVPVLGIAARSLKKEQMILLLGCLIFFHAVIKSVVPAQLTADALGMDAMWYVVLFFVAAYIRRFTELGKGNLSIGKTITAVIAYVAGAFLIFGEAMILRTIWLKTGSLSYILSISYAYDHILVLVTSVALFIAFLNFRPGKKAGRVFAFLGKYSLGVYLLHENLSVRYAWEKWLWADKVTSAIGVVAIAIIAATIVFTTGVIIDLCGSFVAYLLLGKLKVTPGFKTIYQWIVKADKIFSKERLAESYGEENGR